jgi:hypothetical protein
LSHRRSFTRAWADLYREKVTALANGLKYEESRTGAAEALRGLVDTIVPTPEGETPSDDDLVQMMLVAGARNRHYLQLWRLSA